MVAESLPSSTEASKGHRTHHVNTPITRTAVLQLCTKRGNSRQAGVDVERQTQAQLKNNDSPRQNTGLGKAARRARRRARAGRPGHVCSRRCSSKKETPAADILRRPPTFCTRHSINDTSHRRARRHTLGALPPSAGVALARKSPPSEGTVFPPITVVFF